MSLHLLKLSALALTLHVGAANAFEKVSSRDEFMTAVADKSLTRFGITVDVTPAGEIIGRAFGRDVSGDWEWQDGFFCRSLFWGERDLGDNCQEVRINGDTLRFTSDQGAGEYADLRLR
jgi:hypothetical protein